jgi:hypothetical protein
MTRAELRKEIARLRLEIEARQQATRPTALWVKVPTVFMTPEEAAQHDPAATYTMQADGTLVPIDVSTLPPGYAGSWRCPISYTVDPRVLFGLRPGFPNHVHDVPPEFAVPSAIEPTAADSELNL